MAFRSGNGNCGFCDHLSPREMFIAGPAHPEWTETCDAILPDAHECGTVGGIGRELAPLFHAISARAGGRLPRMTPDYLRHLIFACSGGVGTIPHLEDRFEPFAAVYPISALRLAEDCLRSGDYSLQRFAAGCISEGIDRAQPIEDDEALFLNMNTPDDLAIAAGWVV